MNKTLKVLESESFESFLVDRHILSTDLFCVIRREMNKKRVSFQQTLLDLYLVKEKELAELLSEFFNLPLVDIALLDFLFMDVAPFVSEELLSRPTWVPFKREGSTLHVAVTDPSNTRELNLIKAQLSEFTIIFYVAPLSQIEKKFQAPGAHSVSMSRLLTSLDESSSVLPSLLSAELIPCIFDKCLEEATQKEASDIHWEPENKFIRIRFRIDGQLHPYRFFHKDFWDSLCVHIKVCGLMNIAESRLPQSGRFSRKIWGEEIDFRISSHPTKYGESIVIRILDRKKALIPLEKIGFPSPTIARLKEAIQNKQGLFIVVGPTGSGKTTTLYSILNELNSSSYNIMTLEQPIEYELPFIRQTEIHEGSSFTFANGVRSTLRQDPDILLIGEIRDSDTAHMALRASMTGRQVYTTLHAPRALGALQRLEDFGISLSVLTSNLKGLLSQRLVRKLCLSCRKQRKISSQEAALMKIKEDHFFYDPTGCEACAHTGFKGRFPLVEFISCTERFNHLILKKAPLLTLEKEARKTGYAPLSEQGVQHLVAGNTSPSEVLFSIPL